jgi:hypothetical protein
MNSKQCPKMALGGSRAKDNNKHALPLTSMKHPMIIEAFQQSNAAAKREGCDTTELLKDHEGNVCVYHI